MTFLNFSDYLKYQLNREVAREEFSKFVLNQKLMRVGKRSEMNANILFYYDNTTDVILDVDNVITGDQLEFHSCDRNVIYYSVAQPARAGKETLLLKAELDKAVVAYNMMFLIKKVSLIKAKDLNTTAVAAPVTERVAEFA